jgi:Putative adhesin
MKRLLSAGLVVSAALAASGCLHGRDWGTALKASVDESRPLAKNGHFSLDNVNGRVEVTGWDEAQVKIEATKRADSERALDALRIEIEGDADAVRVRTRYPQPRFMGGSGRVDYVIHVPRTARVSVENVNGRVEVADVEAEVEASAVNGSVEASLSRVDPEGRSRLHSTNGSVRLTLPADVNAEIEASTVNGGVGCDFDLDGGRQSRRKLEGRIGSGGARFDLGTVNGSVYIDRALSPRAASRPVAEATPEADDR